MIAHSRIITSHTCLTKGENKMTQLQLAFPSLMGKTIFDDFFRNDVENLVTKSTTGFPVTDIYKDETGNSIIEMALAGYTNNDITIETENNKITIVSDGTESVKGRRIARRSFRKTFINYDSLLDLTTATATFEHGLLRLTIPTKEVATKRFIKIE
tara:strand:+ start:1687 stop:2154 length:468 start_codon:yes stop_codon:yes gene_type:complete